MRNRSVGAHDENVVPVRSRGNKLRLLCEVPPEASPVSPAIVVEGVLPDGTIVLPCDDI